MTKVAAGKASGVKRFGQNIECVVMINPYQIGRGPGYQRPPQVSHSRAPMEIMILLGLVKTIEERRKVSEETVGNVERETNTHKGWYLNIETMTGAGRYDGTKECRYTVPTEKVERK